MLIPLTEFICDSCGELIKTPSEGYVEWLENEENIPISSGFRIVHHISKSPKKSVKNRNGGCYAYSKYIGRRDLPLDYFLENIPHYLYYFLDIGYIHAQEERAWAKVGNIREFTEFAKRLTIPYYEEARVYFDKVREDEFFNGYSPISIYTQETLKIIIEKYGCNIEKTDRLPLEE